jgi:peptidyl-prolyl cis-trans isomerase B (cyclophilin B)
MRRAAPYFREVVRIDPRFRQARAKLRIALALTPAGDAGAPVAPPAPGQDTPELAAGDASSSHEAAPAPTAGRTTGTLSPRQQLLEDSTSSGLRTEEAAGHDVDPVEAEVPSSSDAPSVLDAPSSSGRALDQIDRQITANKIDKSRPNWRTTLPRPKLVKFEAGKTYYARMSTSAGTMVIRLMPDIAPMHVTNFLYLAQLRFYDGLSFHRVITGFMAQGGCPVGNGTGNPGYGFDGEFRPGARHNKRGMLSTANSGPRSDGSQFFLTFAPAPWLDGKHTVYGETVEGMEVLKRLEAAGSASGKPSRRLEIERVTIEVR